MLYENGYSGDFYKNFFASCPKNLVSLLYLIIITVVVVFVVVAAVAAGGIIQR